VLAHGTAIRRPGRHPGARAPCSHTPSRARRTPP